MDFFRSYPKGIFQAVQLYDTQNKIFVHLKTVHAIVYHPIRCCGSEFQADEPAMLNDRGP